MMGLFVVPVTEVCAQQIDLSTSKQLMEPVPGAPQRLNSLPMVLAVSPDGQYIASINAGYGTYESKYQQSIAVLETATGKVADFPDDRTKVGAPQTFFSGLAFSRDGKHLYASLASSTAFDAGVTSKGMVKTGNGIVVYTFTNGAIAPERFLPIPLQQLAPGRTTLEISHFAGGDKGVPFPAGIAVTANASGEEQLVVADNLSDDVLLMDAKSGKILTRFDLSESAAVPGTYPLTVMLSKDGTRAFVTLWNASEIVELDLRAGKIIQKLALLKPPVATDAGSHPCATAFSPDGRTIYVALANRDAIAVVNLADRMKLRGLFDARLPGQSYFGAEPQALALSADGSRLYAANAGSDAVAVFDTAVMTNSAAAKGMVEPLGFVPTELHPIALADSGGKLYIATAKGKGTGPNNFPQRRVEGAGARMNGEFTYAPTLLYGSLAAVETAAIEKDLKEWTAVTVKSNRMLAAEEKMQFAASGGSNPIKHVIYIIKENRTYDQLLGDLSQNGKPVGNGDASLAMYGQATTPNQHKLALQFGVFDNFYDSGEVSGVGHVWSTAAIDGDYVDKTWPSEYRSSQRSYDWEGMVAQGYPLEQKIADVNQPASGYLWTNLAAHGKTLLHFGEYISTTFCNELKPEPRTMNPVENPQEGTEREAPTPCPRAYVKLGEEIPEVYGGGMSKYPWNIPMVARNVATKPELVGHFDPQSVDFNLRVPDQFRVEVFLTRLKQWEAERKQGKDIMPNFIMLRLPNDHTGGTTPGGPTPKSSVADNDLAIGRAVEAISHSDYWNDTAFFILEDDAQNGADHVDAHRSIALVVSKYSPRKTDGSASVFSSFYTTVSVVRTMENLLGLPPMNNNDAFAPLMSPVFAGAGEQPAFNADYSNRDNGLIYTANPKTAPGARASARMDFTHADQADARKLNVILWKDAMGDKPVPPMLLVKTKQKKDDDD